MKEEFESVDVLKSGLDMIKELVSVIEEEGSDELMELINSLTNRLENVDHLSELDSQIFEQDLAKLNDKLKALEDSFELDGDEEYDDDDEDEDYDDDEDEEYDDDEDEEYDDEDYEEDDFDEEEFEDDEESDVELKVFQLPQNQSKK